ncbi:toll/interleukin-1 receptor domain-containing protein [Nostoc sp.]|uniref:toll/interleukin-1 receptor domain-containing protein n=1 Tax=Nostoc sp. TaxID=1180 RepID=UPI002FF980D9
MGFADIDMQDARDLTFTGRVYLYSEQPVSAQLKEQINSKSELQGHSLIFRSVEYVEQRNKFEKPQAFISHDSRDKLEIAQPLAIRLQKLMCPVWYDEYSLKVGDSLRDSIEKGLKECQKCVFIITQNFLSNGGWSKREYDSVFTREIIEKRNVIIPIWYNVTPKDVYSYSPILADRVAVDWSLGIDKVVNKILPAINA